MVKQAFSVSFSSPHCLLRVAHLAFSPSHSLPKLESMRERAREPAMRERESELGGSESDSGAVHERTHSKIPRVDERPSSPPSHRLRAPQPRPGIPDAAYLDPRPQ
ncbi:N-acetyltransferase 9-like protein [Pyrus ussuriensis x Pyrus communis]|uniref:N-acetyltransferase 9-like protein n=1 Tax=Pyrus ussuriensis x Pyrus communis TaxID=2448454 RepID=A0A5N5HTU2_9ROSA|nr:N-acetyltransferase 9-like protein [Pyrus ussuriensis x Pyrus communis]